MKTIWKYKLSKKEVSEIEIPKGALMLSAQEQACEVCLWFLVDPSLGTERRRFLLFMTGQEIVEEDILIIGTVQMLGGNFVVHVFEEIIR